MPTRPTGRKTQVTSGGTGVHKGEQYHGSGPVGREASGSRPSSGNSMPGGGRNVSSGGSYPGGSRGSGGGGLLRLINFLECETHRETLLEYLKQLAGIPDDQPF